MRPRWKRVVFIAPFALLGMVLFIFLGGAIVQFLWNWLLPGLFGFSKLTFWQALGLLALSRILFGGMGGRGGGSRWGRSRFRERMAERWESMTPEERERARRHWRGRWGHCRFDEEGGKRDDS